MIRCRKDVGDSRTPCLYAWLSPQPRITLALTPLDRYFQLSLDSSEDLAQYRQPVQGDIVPVLILKVKGTDRDIRDSEGPYDHLGVALEDRTSRISTPGHAQSRI